MNDSTDNKDPEQQEGNEKVSLKLIKTNEVKKLALENPRWTPIQDLMQEIVATYTVINPNEIPSITNLRKQLIEEINKKYIEDEDTKKLMLGNVPSLTAICKWFKNKDFNDAIWEKIKSSGLFTKERRVVMINSLFNRGTQKDTAAAKIWLQLSGDLKEDSTSKDKTIETFREINKILHKKESS
jgi:hypothetical protein